MADARLAVPGELLDAANRDPEGRNPVHQPDSVPLAANPAPGVPPHLTAGDRQPAAHLWTTASARNAGELMAGVSICADRNPRLIAAPDPASLLGPPYAGRCHWPDRLGCLDPHGRPALGDRDRPATATRLWPVPTRRGRHSPSSFAMAGSNPRTRRNALVEELSPRESSKPRLGRGLHTGDAGKFNGWSEIPRIPPRLQDPILPRARLCRFPARSGGLLRNPEENPCPISCPLICARAAKRSSERPGHPARPQRQGALHGLCAGLQRPSQAARASTGARSPARL